MNGVFVVLRIISLILIVLALMLLGADIITSLEKHGQITTRSIEQVWAAIDPSGVAGFKAWLEHTLPSPVPGWIEALLKIWGWLVTGVIGVILAFLFGRRTADVE
ncbi:MAG: hypothetical protein HY243_07360 [Proteobacteria bacterium]|nr:hypothetical protein [Pseudomonadota bacterium]